MPDVKTEFGIVNNLCKSRERTQNPVEPLIPQCGTFDSGRHKLVLGIEGNDLSKWVAECLHCLF